MGRRRIATAPFWIAPRAIALGIAASCWGAGSFIGADRCAGCHPEEAAAQRVSAHAGALYRPGEHPLAIRFSDVRPAKRPPNFLFEFAMRSGTLSISASGEGQIMNMAVNWAFGAGRQGVTFVSRADDNWYLEHAFSYFPAAGVMDRTPGHDQRAETLTQAVGILYPADDSDAGILGCFECHSTGPVDRVEGQGFVPFETGIQCEACHGPGWEHAAALRRGDARAGREAIENPGRLAARDMIRACGKCHRAPGSVESVDWDDPWNVRHAPPYLNRSSCFQKSNGALSCITCHDPHGLVRRDDVRQYSERCGACHQDARHPMPVGADCTGCHMPKVRPHPRLAFTNHWIGVYAPDRPLRPVR